MFRIWKRAWRDAVENFRRELDPDRYHAMASDQARAMRRDLAEAFDLHQRLEREIDETRRNLEYERGELDRCRRREELANGIGDHETARIAREYAAQHRERAEVLQQKLDALMAEIRLHERTTRTMLETLDRLGIPHQIDSTDDEDAQFRELEDQARERAVEERLEELKKRMR